MKCLQILCLFFLFSCATDSLTYKPIGNGSRSGGYVDGPNLIGGGHRVTYAGNKKTPESLIKEYWHRRSGEICPAGYEVESFTFNIEEYTLAYTGDALLSGTNVAMPIFVEASKIIPKAEGVIHCHNE